jgi:hypothetical protein
MAEAAAPETPKMDLKMMVLPVLFLLQKQIDMKDPQVINYARIGLATAALLAAGAYFMIWKMVENNKDKKTVWIPPKAPPSIPFLSPPAEPAKPEDYTKTTIPEHEKKLLQEALQGLGMSVGIAIFMSMKFDIHLSCMMQAVMVPIGLWDNVLVQKYFMGAKKDKLYNELESPPAAVPETPTLDDEDDDDNTPRVEELTSDDDVVKVEKTDADPSDDDKEDAPKSSTTNDID